jgi:tetratricopeptide (TPR) repeat protein
MLSKKISINFLNEQNLYYSVIIIVFFFNNYTNSYENSCLTFFPIFVVSFVFTRINSSKEEALAEFRKENYSEAIAILEKAAQENPNDAEIFYYLGFFNHYRAYDSKPLGGYDYSYSERIFEYLEKAIELDPQMGNARYFYGAECSGNAFAAMQDGDCEGVRKFYKLADRKGAYPEWLKEFGRNILNSCSENAILFLGGNSDFDICVYLQLNENLRRDVTIIPIGNIDRPWYVEYLSENSACNPNSLNLSLTLKQIQDIHPYKWKTNTLMIPVSDNMKSRCNLPGEFRMEWTLEPDYISGRDHSIFISDSTQKRTYLSPQRAILYQIIMDNFSKRPVFFSNLASPFFLAGLDKNLMNCGLISELMPFETEDTEYSVDLNKIMELLKTEKLKDYRSILDKDIPRISNCTSLYLQSVIIYAAALEEGNETNQLKELAMLFDENIKIGFDKQRESAVSNYLKAVINLKE